MTRAALLLALVGCACPTPMPEPAPTPSAAPAGRPAPRRSHFSGLHPEYKGCMVCCHNICAVDPNAPMTYCQAMSTNDCTYMVVMGEP